MTDETIEPIERWEPADATIWIRINKLTRQNAAGNDEDVFYAQVILNGQVAGQGECVNSGANARENLAERNAVSLAMIEFSQNVGKVKFVRVYQPKPTPHEPDPGRPRGRVGLEHSVLDWADIFGQTGSVISWDPRPATHGRDGA